MIQNPKGYIIEDPSSGLELFAISGSLPDFRYEGWVYETFAEVRGLLGELERIGYRCICRKLTEVKYD